MFSGITLGDEGFGATQAQAAFKHTSTITVDNLIALSLQLSSLLSAVRWVYVYELCEELKFDFLWLMNRR